MEYNEFIIFPSTFLLLLVLGSGMEINCDSGSELTGALPHILAYQKAVLRIHDILGWIRIQIRESMPLTNGSGYWIRILLFSSLTFKIQQKLIFLTQFFLLITF